MDIPEDVVILILVWLPVQSLLRFRCVCKAWRDLIGSRRFTDMHLQQGSPNKYLVVKRFDARDESTMLSYYGRDEDGESLRKAAPDLSEFPPVTMFSGACNGIILVCAEDLSDTEEENKNPLYLCNPATRELRKIPDRPFGRQRARPSMHGEGQGPPFDCKRVGAGFGYDHRTNDYKVVSVMLFLEDSYYLDIHYGELKIEIYDLSSNSWRVADTIFPTVHLHPDPGMDDLPNYPNDLNMDYEGGMFGDFICGVFFKGSIHWKPSGNDKVILAFNISDEVMRAFHLPRGISGYENSFPRSLFLLEDSLAFVQCVRDENYVVSTSFYVWVMVEYGDEESWIKRFYFQPGIHMDVIAIWDDMLICETEEGELASCNLQEDAPRFRKHHHIKRYGPYGPDLSKEHYFSLTPMWKLMAAIVMHKESLVRLRY